MLLGHGVDPMGRGPAPSGCSRGGWWLPMQPNVVSKFWYTADCGPHVAQITGKLWQWLSGSTPRPKRAANGLLAVPWCRELKNAVPDQQLVQGLFRNTFWANLGQFGCSGTLFGAFLCVPEQFHRYKANFAYHTVATTWQDAICCSQPKAHVTALKTSKINSV